MKHLRRVVLLLAVFAYLAVSFIVIRLAFPVTADSAHKIVSESQFGWMTALMYAWYGIDIMIYVYVIIFARQIILWSAKTYTSTFMKLLICLRVEGEDMPTLPSTQPE